MTAPQIDEKALESLLREAYNIGRDIGNSLCEAKHCHTPEEAEQYDNRASHYKSKFEKFIRMQIDTARSTSEAQQAVGGALGILQHAYDWCIEQKLDQQYIGRAIYTAMANLCTKAPASQGIIAMDLDSGIVMTESGVYAPQNPASAGSGAGAVLESLPTPVIHSSDCAVHNEPAYPKGDCDCGVGRPADERAPSIEAGLDREGAGLSYCLGFDAGAAWQKNRQRNVGIVERHHAGVPTSEAEVRFLQPTPESIDTLVGKLVNYEPPKDWAPSGKSLAIGVMREAAYIVRQHFGAGKHFQSETRAMKIDLADADSLYAKWKNTSEERGEESAFYNGYRARHNSTSYNTSVAEKR